MGRMEVRLQASPNIISMQQLMIQITAMLWIQIEIA